MKYAYAFLAALLLVGASALPLNEHDLDINELDYDIVDFVKLVSANDFVRVIEEHGQDPELWKVLQYLLSDDFHQLVYAAEDLPEFHRYVLYFQKAGYNAFRELREVHKSLGMIDYVPPKEYSGVMSNIKKGGGLNGLIDDLIAILPKKEIQELHAKKLKESPAFAKFSAAMLSPKLNEIRAALLAQKPMQDLLQESKAHGLDYQKCYNFRNQFLGFA